MTDNSIAVVNFRTVSATSIGGADLAATWHPIEAAWSIELVSSWYRATATVVKSLETKKLSRSSLCTVTGTLTHYKLAPIWYTGAMRMKERFSLGNRCVALLKTFSVYIFLGRQFVSSSIVDLTPAVNSMAFSASSVRTDDIFAFLWNTRFFSSIRDSYGDGR